MLFDYISKRRMGIVEILRMSKYIMTKDIFNYIKVLVVLFLPINIVLSMVNTLVANAASYFDLRVVLQSRENIMEFFASPQYKAISRYGFITMLIEMFVVPLIIMSVARIVKNYCTGKESTFETIFKEAFSKGYVLILSTVIYMAILVCGFTCFIIPGVVLLVFMIFYIYNIMLNDAGPWRAIKDSFKLVGKSWFWVALYSLLFFMVKAVLSQIIVMILGFLAVDAVSTAMVTTVASFTDLLYYTAMTVLFLNISTGAFKIKKQKNVIDEIDNNI